MTPSHVHATMRAQVLSVVPVAMDLVGFIRHCSKLDSTVSTKGVCDI